MNDTLSLLNAPELDTRLANISALLTAESSAPEKRPQYANNHIHTWYSFSPYSPTAAVWYARQAGLLTAGLMDHDSIAGAAEFIRAGELADIATTIGLECRVRMDATPFATRRLNNPDQVGIAYMALHGVAHTRVHFLQEVFAPLRKARNLRNQAMLKKLNALLAPCGLSVSWEQVLACSQHANGGSVTERHLLFALATQMEAVIGRSGIPAFLTQTLHLPLSDSARAQLQSEDNPFYKYDLLGVLKAHLVAQFYLPAEKECLHISQMRELAAQTGAQLCYAYLGDVGNSVTGDKKTQTFEDAYLEELFGALREYGVQAVTYMPSRNSPQQLERVMQLCKANGLGEISGEDINSPRQKFICEQLALPQYRHLIAATWDLIAHEKAATARLPEKT